MENSNINIIEIDCYTDASYSKEKFVSVIAYKIHTNPINTIIFEGVKNTQAEINGIEFCIGYCEGNFPNVTIINIYTDCQGAFDIEFKFKSNKFVKINLIKVKGHQKMAHMNSNDLIFKSVDKMARKTLRKL